MKIYKSKTLLSISVKLASGKGKHLMFDAMSDGSGMLRVTNPVLMEAIERHPQYGKWFVLYRNTEPEERDNAQPVAVRTEEESNAGEQQEAGQVDEQPVAARTEEVKVFDSFDDAREWVADTFGIAKKRLMSKVAVINLAAENGVTIEIN